MPRAAPIVVTLALLAPAVAGRADPARPEAAAWHTAALPTTIEALGEAARLGADTGPERLLLEIIRVAHEGPPRESADADRRLAQVTRLLADGRTLPDGNESPAAEVPVPIDSTIWEQAIFRRPIQPGDLVAAILTDRRAALLYAGLAELDGPTLAFFAARPELLTRIHQQHAANFAAFARGLRLRGGRLEVPGGDEATPLWTALVGRSPDAAPEFILDLLARDRGRLAFLYDTLAVLPAPAQQFALGLALPPDAREARLRALYDTVAAADRQWRPDTRPFARPALDAAVLFMEVAAAPDGTLAPPADRGVWQAAFSGAGRPGAETQPADAAWLADAIVAVPSSIGRDRLDMLRFAQRVFGTADADRQALLDALRAFDRFPALALTLERIGARRPEHYAEAAATAGRLGAVHPALAQFQAALALIDRASVVRTLDRPTAIRLTVALVRHAAEWEAPRLDRTGLAAWFDAELIPGLSAATGLPLTAGAEAIMQAALSGVRQIGGNGGASDAPTVLDWEGRPYRVDVAEAERARLQAVRRLQPGVDLDDALAWSRVLRDLTRLRPAAADTGTVLERLDIAYEPVAAELAVLPFAPGRFDGARALRALHAASGSRPALESAAIPLQQAAEALLADTLAALVYAAYLGPASGAVQLAPDVARRHDFGAPAAAGVRSRLTPWSVPFEESGTAAHWRVRGALLGLDLALARLALRRISDEFPQRPRLSQNLRHIFIRSTVLLNPFDADDADRDEVAAAVARGRRRVAALTSAPAGLDDLAQELGLPPGRHAALRWRLVREPEEAPRLFGYTELLRLGRPALPPDRLARWGLADGLDRGCFCLQFPDAQDWSAFRGRPATGRLAMRLPDLNIRVAEMLAAYRLPAALARGVLEAATSDFVTEAPAAHYDDAAGMAAFAAELPDARLEDYVAALVAGGALIALPLPAEAVPR